MATTLMPLDPAVSPQRVTRLLTISASLLPEEVIAGRRARRTRAWVIVVVVLVAGLLGSWFAYARHQTTLADDKLSEVTVQVTDLQRDQHKYADVVEVQNQTKNITKQLRTLMANDLPWASLLDTLRTTGTASGIEVTGVNGILNATNASASDTAADLPSTSGSTSIGSLIVTGTAPDKDTIAKFVDALSTQTVVADPYLTSATKGSDDDNLQFSLRVDITGEARCGRFTAPCKTGGK
ncbi:hypothetical protein [Actinoplanes friuliensis]|jgi:hypothetical protein|uniref:Fimbrial assembly family protein n=1 Tax=Actinoplanes friuliensis DSM 7358 TaxID=1246995 RepID=U5VRN9_9ACTN|nr:hypothetical protein [Actinoplanes friuliensis]AGZ39482.1 hypothetical protein AFR_05965 [Actinoplanes friuliensis DSM 7358]